MDNFLEQYKNARLYDLGQPYFPGMPHYPTHPPFLFGPTKKHGEYILPGEISSAADAIALGTHVGTHIDALCHFSCGGKMYGGIDASDMDPLSIDTVPPILRRGVLLDITGQEGHNVLPPGFAITPRHLDTAATKQKVEINKGDVVLLRTGWASLWNDPARYINNITGPGPELDGAVWLSSKGIYAAGSDTVAFERVPSGMQVHKHLLVESGIHIIEALDLEQLAANKIYEFLFIAIPMKIRGATGSPVRPIALLPRI